jgi:putative tryptophan/tyrosine transport system substrate-binding protein
VIRRREFITLLGGGVAAWPLAAGAQQPAKRVIGYLGSADSDHMVGALREGLAERGYIEGQSISIEVHDVAGQYDRLPSLAAEFVKRQVAIIVAVGNANAALAAKKATAVIPIVFANGGDPIKLGLVGSINRPGGNVTGVTFFNSLLISKRLELLSEVIPRSARIGFLMNPTTPNADSDVKDMETAARAAAREVSILKVTNEREIDAAFSSLPTEGIGGLMTGADAFIASRRRQIVALAARAAVPAVYNIREFADAGGLMSYGTNILDAVRQAGVYAGRVLQGEKPGNLPILQATRTRRSDGGRQGTGGRARPRASLDGAAGARFPDNLVTPGRAVRWLV